MRIGHGSARSRCVDGGFGHLGAWGGVTLLGPLLRLGPDHLGWFLWDHPAGLVAARDPDPRLWDRQRSMVLEQCRRRGGGPAAPSHVRGRPGPRGGLMDLGTRHGAAARSWRRQRHTVVAARGRCLSHARCHRDPSHYHVAARSCP